MLLEVCVLHAVRSRLSVVFLIKHYFCLFPKRFLLYISSLNFLYFSMEQFSSEYSNLSYLSKDFENLNKQMKPISVGSLMIARTALQIADSYMKKRSDTILKSMDDLMK